MRTGLFDSFLIVGLLFLFTSAEATVTEAIVQNEFWDGVTAYMAVDRQIVQKKLDDWHKSNSRVCNAPTLYLPETPIFPNILDENQHAMHIAVGHLIFHDFDGYIDSNFSGPIPELKIGVTIPFLADSPKGIPHYSLNMVEFQEKSPDDVPQPNIIHSHVSVDEIRMDGQSFVMRDGSDEMVLSLAKQTNPCKPTSRVIRHEFAAHIEHDFHFGNPEPDFSFCDRHPVENHFCSTAKRIRCTVSRSFPNICQTSYHGVGREVCQATLEFVNISSRFRDALLLPDGPIDVIAAEALNGNFSIGLKYPCIEDKSPTCRERNM